MENDLNLVERPTVTNDESRDEKSVHDDDDDAQHHLEVIGVP